MDNLFFFVGLGNPGKKYRYTRHNVGFIVLEYFINQFSENKIAQDYKFSSIINTIFLHNKKVICLFPLTFMNLSGISIRQILDYYKIDNFKDKLVVIHDDMDINLGSFKFKFNGGDAGHNGIKSIIKNIGKDFYRIRVGISRPPKDYKNYVLEEFSNEELIKLKETLPTICKVMENTVLEGVQLTISKLGIFK